MVKWSVTDARPDPGSATAAPPRPTGALPLGGRAPRRSCQRQGARQVPQRTAQARVGDVLIARRPSDRPWPDATTPNRTKPPYDGPADAWFAAAEPNAEEARRDPGHAGGGGLVRSEVAPSPAKAGRWGRGWGEGPSPTESVVTASLEPGTSTRFRVTL